MTHPVTALEVPAWKWVDSGVAAGRAGRFLDVSAPRGGGMAWHICW